MPADLVTPGSSRGSESPMDQQPERAHRACEKCTRTKKKCDKALPACSRCTRLTTTCCYDFVYTAPAMTLVEPTAIAGYLHGSKGSEYAGAAAAKAPAHSFFDPNLDISPAMIMALLTSRSINWRESTELYFRTMNPSLAIVHPDLFARRIDGLGPSDSPRDCETALLLVCMQLVTQFINSSSAQMANGKEMMTLPTYVVAKRILSTLRGQSNPSVELIQCAILLCLFEFGHGDVNRAYVSIGDANTMAKFLRIRPGKYVDAEKDQPVAPEDEERRSLYWGLFVVDRLIHVETRLMWMPLQVPTPAEDDLLPTTNIVWDKQTQAPVAAVQRYPAGVSPSVVLGPFQRLSQCAMLLSRALVWELNTYQLNQPATMDSFADLDVATRALIEAMLWQASRWGEYYECFATCTCLLLLLYCRYLNTIDSVHISSSTSNVEVLKAIAGINFTVRIIADTTRDLNDHLARRPDLLAPCSPVTPYSAYHCLRVLSSFEHVIPDADQRFHNIYSSLHFFAKRWGVAGQLVQTLESYLATKDTVAFPGPESTPASTTEPWPPVPDEESSVHFAASSECTTDKPFV